MNPRDEAYEALKDRVQTVADEAFGPFPVQSADDSVTEIERGISRLRQELCRAENERDEARTNARIMARAADSEKADRVGMRKLLDEARRERDELEAIRHAEEAPIRTELRLAKAERDEARRGVRELWEIANDAVAALADFADDEEEIEQVAERLRELKPVDSPPLCPVCHWPLAADTASGCVAGNCSQRGNG